MTVGRQLGLFAGVVAVATVVVVSVANPLPHPGGDNAGYVALAYGMLTEGAYLDVFDPERLPHTKYPPVFPAILALLMAAGARTWVALKVSAAAATVAAVAFSYLWSARVLGAVGGAVVALLTALSVGVVYYSQWVLSDPVFMALTLAALYSLARAAEGGSVRVGWLVAGVVGAGLAYFTRSAGLPLVVALLGWLALRRAWRPLAGAAAALGVPMLLWWMRGRVGGVAQYASEFWMVNPYDPGLGTVGLGGLVGRVVENVGGYTTRHLPLGVVGADAPAVPLIGLALVAASVAGWALRTRKEPGPAELFFPLYWGLILLWPTVWSGDRFALPLLPLTFVYGALALRAATTRLQEAARPAVLAAASLVLLGPAAVDWRAAVERSDACPERLAREDPWACYGPGVQSFMAAASWSGAALPEGAAVLTRKPRHFYVQSGVPSRAFAFFEDPDAQLELADRLGARYILLDQWDAQAARYVAPAVTARPGAFCFVRAFGLPRQAGAQLLGVRPADARVEGSSEGPPALVRCPDEYASEPPEVYTSSGRIPLLSGLDS